MASNRAIHGGTDAGLAPRFDFSSNANALGPNPFILEKIQSVNPVHYPDPNYIEVHKHLADFHGVSHQQMAVGAGASELILRLTRWPRTAGSILTLAPTFGEYARVANLAKLPHKEAHTEEEFLTSLKSCTLGFLCLPNNPTGTLYTKDFLGQVAALSAQSGTIIVIDLAYQSLSQTQVVIPEVFWQLHAPNKAHGMTGIRAGYLFAPESLQEFRDVAPSWVVSAHGEAFLRWTLLKKAQDWVQECCPILWQWRKSLAEQLATLYEQQIFGDANFGLVNVGNATQVSNALRDQDIRVRDCTSFGLPEWIRVSAQSELAQKALISALKFLKE
jgi:histidinol-phosphate aminotransferase